MREDTPASTDAESGPLLLTVAGLVASFLQNAPTLAPDRIKDVLLVDFTRPIFSDDRCELLEFAPVLASADQTPENLKLGFLQNLGNPPAGTPAAELKNNLLTEGAHDVAVDAFTAAWVMQTSFEPLLLAVSINPESSMRQYSGEVLGSNKLASILFHHKVAKGLL